VRREKRKKKKLSPFPSTPRKAQKQGSMRGSNGSFWQYFILLYSYRQWHQSKNETRLSPATSSLFIICLHKHLSLYGESQTKKSLSSVNGMKKRKEEAGESWSGESWGEESGSSGWLVVLLIDRV
jgi:hypothetical protein